MEMSHDVLPRIAHGCVAAALFCASRSLNYFSSQVEFRIFLKVSKWIKFRTSRNYFAQIWNPSASIAVKVVNHEHIHLNIVETIAHCKHSIRQPGPGVPDDGGEQSLLLELEQCDALLAFCNGKKKSAYRSRVAIGTCRLMAVATTTVTGWLLWYWVPDQILMTTSKKWNVLSGLSRRAVSRSLKF